MKCNKDVSEVEKEQCKLDHYDDLDLEGLGGPARLRRKQSNPQTTISFSAIADEFLELTWVRTLLENKELWYWDKTGKVWRNGGESFFMAWFGEKYPLLRRADYVETRFHMQKRTLISSEQFRENPYWLNFMGNELNLKTLHNDGPTEYDHYSKTKLSTELDLKAPPPFEFLKALQNAIPDGEDLYHCLQAFSTILLRRTMRIEKAFFFLGSGGNGKSTIMKAIEGVFENYISHVDLNDLVRDRFASASLEGKLANIYADIQSLKLKDMAIFKAISSGDAISIGDKYERRHTAIISIMQFYSANKMPLVDKDQGFMRRASPILFDMRIQNPDPYIDDKLSTPEERKRILAMLVRVAKITKAKGFLFEKTQDEIQRILEDKEDPVIQFLNDPEWVQHGTDYEIEHGELHNIYKTYCKIAGFPPKQLRAFSRYISEKGVTTRKSNSMRYWQRIGSPRQKEVQTTL